jgi:hypothetical protein
MIKSGRARSTFATVVAAAVVLAVATTGGAVAGGLVTSKQIKNNTIKSKDVKNNNLQGIDVLDGSLTGDDVANGSLSSGEFTSAPAGVARGYVYSGVSAPPIGEVQALTSEYIFNSAGGGVTRTRTAAGRYTITFAGLDLSAGNVQVTSYGAAAQFCKVVGWGGSNASVACFDHAGAAADSEFSLAFIR